MNWAGPKMKVSSYSTSWSSSIRRLIVSLAGLVISAPQAEDGGCWMVYYWTLLLLLAHYYCLPIMLTLQYCPCVALPVKTYTLGGIRYFPAEPQFYQSILDTTKATIPIDIDTPKAIQNRKAQLFSLVIQRPNRSQSNSCSFEDAIAM